MFGLERGRGAVGDGVGERDADSCLRHAHRFAVARVSTRIRSSASVLAAVFAEEGLARRHERQGHGAHLQGSEHPPPRAQTRRLIPDADARRRQGDVVLPDRGVREKKYFQSTLAASGRARTSNFPPPRAPSSPSPPPTPIHASSSAREENTLASSSTSPRADACPSSSVSTFLVAPPPPPPPRVRIASTHESTHASSLAIDSSIIIINHHRRRRHHETDRPRPTPRPRRPVARPRRVLHLQTPPPLYPHHIMTSTPRMR